MAIAVDLDGTLAEYRGWKGEEHIGEVIKPMLDKVIEWIEAGEEVVIFTARADSDYSINIVKNWLYNINLGDLEVTNIKRKSFHVIYDDRAVQVIKNTGVLIT